MATLLPMKAETIFVPIMEWHRQLFSLLGIHFHSLVYGYPVSQHHLLKRLTFLHCGFLAPLSKISWAYMCGFISVLHILLHFSFVYYNVSNILCWFLKVCSIVCNQKLWGLGVCPFCLRWLWLLFVFCGFMWTEWVMAMGFDPQHTQRQWCGLSRANPILFCPFFSVQSGRFHCRFFKVQGRSWPLLLLMENQREDKCVTDTRDTFWDLCSSAPLVPALDPSQEDGKELVN